MYIDPVSTTAGASAPTEENDPKIIAAKNAKVGAQAIFEEGADIAVWEREFTPETQTAIDRYLHFLTNQPRSPLPKVESTGSALSLALEIAKALEAATPPHLQDEMRLIARDIMGRLCDYAENSSSNGLAMRFEFRRDAMPESMPGIVCTTYSLSALVSSQVAADKAAYFAENFASKQVRQFNPSWVGTTTANRDLGAYMALGDIPHILLVIGSTSANDMRTSDNNADLDLIRAMGPDILSIQGAMAAAAAAFTADGNMAFGNDIAELMSKLAELQSLADHAGTEGALDTQAAHIEALLKDIAGLEQTITSNLDTQAATTLMKGVHDTLQNIAVQLGNTPLADMVMELAVQNPAQARLEAAMAEAETVLAEMLEAGDLSAEQEAEVQKLKDMISNHMAGEPVSSALIAQLETVGKLANGAIGEKLTKSMQSLTSAQAAVATLAAGLGIDVLRQSASMVTKLHEMQTAIEAARTGSATLTTSQLENIRAVEPQIAATLAQLQAAPATPATLSSLGKLETAISQVQGALPANAAIKAESIAGEASQMSVVLHVKTAELNDTSVQNIVRSVSTLQNLEDVQVQLSQNALSSPQQTALSNQIAQAVEALKAAPASPETLQKLNALATTIASIPPSANFLPPGAQATMPGVIAGISALGGKQAEGAPQGKKAEQAAKAEEKKAAQEKQEAPRGNDTTSQQPTNAPTNTPANAPTNNVAPNPAPIQSPSNPAPAAGPVSPPVSPSAPPQDLPTRTANDATPIVFAVGATSFTQYTQQTGDNNTPPTGGGSPTDINKDVAQPVSPPSDRTATPAPAAPTPEEKQPAPTSGPCKGGKDCDCNPTKDFGKAADGSLAPAPAYNLDERKEQLRAFINQNVPKPEDNGHTTENKEHVHGPNCGCKDHFKKAAEAPEGKKEIKVTNDDDMHIGGGRDPRDILDLKDIKIDLKCGDCKGERGCCTSFNDATRLAELEKAKSEKMDLSSNDNDNDAYTPAKKRNSRNTQRALNR